MFLWLLRKVLFKVGSQKIYYRSYQNPKQFHTIPFTNSSRLSKSEAMFWKDTRTMGASWGMEGGGGTRARKMKSTRYLRNPIKKAFSLEMKCLYQNRVMCIIIESQRRSAGGDVFRSVSGWHEAKWEGVLPPCGQAESAVPYITPSSSPRNTSSRNA